MKYDEIVKSGEVIYAPRARDGDIPNWSGEDGQLRKWSVKMTSCEVRYYRTYPMEPQDSVICGILKSQEIVKARDLACVLGFDVCATEIGGSKRYCDPAEIGLFNEILKSVVKWGLVRCSEEDDFIGKDADVFLTDLGVKALEQNHKYKFFTGRKKLIEHFGLSAVDRRLTAHFPFCEALGATTPIEQERELDYKQLDIGKIMSSPDTELIVRHGLQSEEEHHIYFSEETRYFDLASLDVDIRVFRFNREYFPIAFFEGRICVPATEILNDPLNHKTKENKVEWGLYLQLLNDSRVRLDYSKVGPFADIIDIDRLIGDARLDWSDPKIFDLISSSASANQWVDISEHCPIDVVIDNIDRFAEKWDWGGLTKRLPKSYILETAEKYPWSFGVFSQENTRDVDLLKRVLPLPALKDFDWDWDSIMPLLDLEYVGEHLSEVDFPLYALTKKNPLWVQKFALRYPNARWDWCVITSEFDLKFLLANIEKWNYEQIDDALGQRVHKNHLILSILIDRAFMDGTVINDYCESPAFRSVVASNLESLRSFNVNVKEYLWNDSAVSFFEDMGLLTWESTKNTLGFECNPALKWDSGFFAKYSTRVATQKGYAYLSQRISDFSIVVNNPSFNWDWPSLLDNSCVVDGLFGTSACRQYLDVHAECWSIVTKHLSLDTIRQNLNLGWDWKVLTERVCGSIKSTALGATEWIDKWDWTCISARYNKSVVLNNLYMFRSRWDWPVLLERLTSEELQEYFDNVVQAVSVLESSALSELWKSITRKFSYSQLDSYIQSKNRECCKWDYDYFYSLPDFDVASYLRDHKDFVDWRSLSSSDSLRKLLQKDENLAYKTWVKKIEKLLTGYPWDFGALSKQAEINGCPEILKAHAGGWDWDYLSRYSSCFSNDEGNIDEFHDRIVFGQLSLRSDCKLTPSLIRRYKDKDWNWAALSRNTSATLSMELVVQLSDKSWDWRALSARKDLQISNRALVSLLDKDWDWQLLSNRDSIVYNFDLIRTLVDKAVELDWEKVSSQQSFDASAKCLAFLSDKKLNWHAVSANPTLEVKDLSVLEKYADRLDWQIVSAREDFVISNSTLERFAAYIDWHQASASQDVDFTDSVVEKYSDKWDWLVLQGNPRVQLSSSKYAAQFSCISFLGQFNRPPRIYHFTHLYNAVEIIKNRKILSRNKAKGGFTSSAGGVVARRHTAHLFARFYFRPQTPTQFYNECLGKDITNRYYESARQMGLPKCPYPVFFEFDLTEVIRQMPQKCYYSTGNMQTDRAQCVKVTERPNALNTEFLYSTVCDGVDVYKEYSQQEFLVLDEFDFSELNSFKIICYSEQQAQLLKEQLGDDPICERIIAEGVGIFHRGNSHLDIRETDGGFKIVSNYHSYGNYAYFSVRGECKSFDIMNPKCILKETPNEIIAYPEIEIGNISKDGRLEIYFVDNAAATKEWLVYRLRKGAYQ